MLENYECFQFNAKNGIFEKKSGRCFFIRGAPFDLTLENGVNVQILSTGNFLVNIPDKFSNRHRVFETVLNIIGELQP